MNIFTCQICGKPHEVYLFADVKGKPKLMFTCEHIPKQKMDRAGHILTRSSVSQMPYIGPKLSGPFREVWSAKLTEKRQGEGQLQLTMMK